jgi:sporulation protein YunB
MFLLVIPILLIQIIDNYFGPKTNEYIYNQTKVLVSNTFSKLLNESIIPFIDKEELVYINYKESKEVNSVILNTSLYNEILGKIYILLENNFQNNMENFFKELEIPIGSLISKTVFAGRGHIIDIPIIPIGSYKVDLKTESIEIGINSQKLEVFIEIDIDVETIIPFNPMTHNIKSSFLLSSIVVQGNVPNYYYASNSGESFPYVPNV